MHKTTIVHSEEGNEFVAKVIDFKEFFQVFLNCGDKEEILILNKKDGKITHTTGEK